MEGFFIETTQGRIPVTLVASRPRSRILKLEDGRYAKIVKDSRTVRNNPQPNRSLARWLQRNRISWNHLREQTHPGLLRVGERVVDNNGDEGYICQGLDVFDIDADDHPARMSFRVFLECAIRLARALGVMHQAGFVHGDVTPGNVCFHEGLPVLIDFEMTVRSGQFPGLYLCTEAGQSVCLTPDCCSPEQVLGRRVTAASDVFCLGLTVLSWLTERFGVDLAYFGQTEGQSLDLCSRADYPHWSVARVRSPNQNLIVLLRKATALESEDRFQNGDDIADELVLLMRNSTSTQLERSLHNPADRRHLSSREGATCYLDIP